MFPGRVINNAEENVMKKIVTLLAATMLVVGLSGFAIASDYKGKVTKVKGKTVTVQITKGKASKIKVGSKVELEVKSAGSAPKKGGGDMLQGC
jgi:uncharacterized OB-fold protein